MKQRVVVGMSGGVDSAVAAFLLKEQGYEVLGVTLQLWGTREGGCLGPSLAQDAGKVSEALGIPHFVVDFRGEFRQKVVDYFVEEYLQGRTPNPCIACNRYVKWEALLKRSLALGADYIATGHYARVERLNNGRYAIRNSAAAAKDQTYALYRLTQEQLARTLFPVGGYSKEEIRGIAAGAGLPVADKPDSQEICFVPEGDYGAFVEQEAEREMEGRDLPERRRPCPGNFVTTQGEILGRHQGISHYTVGQRRGLGLPMGKRIYVTQIRPRTNEVVLGGEEDLLTDTVFAGDLNFMSVPDIEGPVRVLAKIRYNHRGEYCVVEKLGEDRVRCSFERPVRAAAPGQAIVFYDGEYVLGGGTICSEVTPGRG